MREKSKRRIQIETLLRLGHSAEEVATMVGCHSGYVRKVRSGGVDKKFASDLRIPKDRAKLQYERALEQLEYRKQKLSEALNAH